MKRLLAAAGAFLALTGMQAPQAPGAARPQVEMWRLDCGTVDVQDLNLFSDTFAYVGRAKTLTDSCYLIRRGENYLLWDTGLPGELANRAPGGTGPMRMSLNRRLVDQLAQIGVRPDQVNFVGISHRHDDHTGQAADFPKATLLMGAEDFEAMKKGPSAARLEPWIKGGSKVEPVARDHDVFGDGTAVILDMPGHTEGHQSLLVRLPKTGAVLLSGDLFHFNENVKSRGMPIFNTNRADTLASFDRFDAIARNLKAKVIVQHEPADVAKLPAFPKSAQ
jgi:glyoxylase-like metal-dependent hydrolase (beta-lactamase superfamily II)